MKFKVRVWVAGRKNSILLKPTFPSIARAAKFLTDTFDPVLDAAIFGADDKGIDFISGQAYNWSGTTFYPVDM